MTAHRLPVPFWTAVAMLLSAFAVVTGLTYALVSFVGPWLADILGIHWVPVTGGYLVIEPGSPLAQFKPYATALLPLPILALSAYLCRAYLREEARS